MYDPVGAGNPNRTDGNEPALGPSATLRAQLVERLLGSIVEQAAALPLRNPTVLSRVARMCGDAKATPASLAREASHDESFVALLLRVANSASAMAASRVGDAAQAVTRLGFGTVRGLAMAAMASPTLGHRHADPATAAAVREHHRHAIRVGLIAEHLAPSGVSADLALTAGVLHNLGLSVLARFAPDAFARLLASAKTGAQLADVESRLLGFTHAELGARLAEHWAYPDELVVAIRFHDAAEPPDRLSAIVQIADLLVRTAGVGIEAPAPVPAAVEQLAAIELRGILVRLEPIFDLQDLMEQRLRDEGIA